MQIIEGIEQRSPEWFDLRKGIVTASDLFRIITPLGKQSKQNEDYALELAAASITYDIEQEGFISNAMQRGIDLEPDAREMYSENFLVHVAEVCFVKFSFFLSPLLL